MSVTISGTNGIDKVAPGAVESGDLPAGTVLQVVNAYYATLTGTSSSTFSDTGLTASITPSSASNKILAIVNMSGLMKNANNISGAFQLVRNGSAALVFEGLAAYTNSGAVNTGSANCNYLDSPASASAVTYTIQFKAHPNATGVFYINNYDASGSASTITLMEIAA